MIPFAELPLTSFGDEVKQMVACTNPGCGCRYEASQGVFHIPGLKFHYTRFNRFTFMALPYCTKVCERQHLQKLEARDGVQQAALAL